MHINIHFDTPSIGTTRDPITEYYRFTSLDGNKATINYSNSTGDKMKFRVEKR